MQSKLKGFIPFCTEINMQTEKDNISVNDVFKKIVCIDVLLCKYIHKYLHTIFYCKFWSV